MSQTVVILFFAFLAYVQGSPRLILGPRCPCQKEDFRPPCPDFGGCAAILCGPGFSCQPCPCDCRTGQCVPNDRP